MLELREVTCRRSMLALRYACIGWFGTTGTGDANTTLEPSAMVRSLASKERSDAGVSAPVERRRLVARLHAGAAYPITLLIAPGGYGKSIALRQYLKSLTEPCVCFALRAEHAELLGFLRGFSEALREDAPHAITTLAGAYERNSRSPKLGVDLARWMYAHLEFFAGVIAVDDLHVACQDPEVANFLTSLIERTKPRVRWILASRSTAGLPLGTWQGYGDADAPVDERDLRFTLDEAREAAHGFGLTIRDEELGDLLALTEGWPAAMSFALRTSTRSSELRNVSAVTREMIYRLLAEQVYTRLDAVERSLLEVATALPVIDIAVLERAGFDSALAIVECLRERTSFIYEESPGLYQCHDLFRDFLRHQNALAGRRAQKSAHERAALALEKSGDVEHAIAAYALAASADDVVRLLEVSGFDLLERARSDVVASAIETLDDQTRRQNPTILALRGTLQAIAGKFTRAESLLRRALARAGNNLDLVATTSLRLASVVGNQGGDVSAILDPVANDSRQRPGYRAEALSLRAARQAIAGDFSIALHIMTIEELLPKIECDATRAKVLHHLGIVSRHLGKVQQAFSRLTQCAELAMELDLFNLASRSYAVLSNLTLHEQDDVEAQLRYAEYAEDAARKAGDALALRTALLQVLSAQMRRGLSQEILATERRLSSMHLDPVVSRYVTLFRSVRLGWEGRFSEAHQLISGHWREMPRDADWAACGGQYALFLAIDGHRDESVAVVKEVSEQARVLTVSGRFDSRCMIITQVLCALAELVNGRATRADRMLRDLNTDDRVERIALKIGNAMAKSISHRDAMGSDEAEKSIGALAGLDYGDVAGLFKAVNLELRRRGLQTATLSVLTPKERDVLRLLATGLLPKEIAAGTARSVHTVRAHIASATRKLDCHGCSEAIARARQLEII